MIPALLILGLLAAEPAEELRSCGSGVVAVARDGGVESLELEGSAAAEPIPQAEHFWVWSEHAPGQKVAPAELSSVLEEITERKRPESTLGIEFLGPVAMPLPEGIVIAAPVEMWQEVPEELLPCWKAGSKVPRKHGQPWRVRFVGHEHGSGWLDVAGREHRVQIALRPAQDRQVELLSAEGEPVVDALATVGPELAELRGAAVIALFGSAEGVLEIRALPAEQKFHLLVEAPTTAPELWSGRAEELPPVLTLQAGAGLEGRVVDAEDQPVAGAELLWESWASAELPQIFERLAESTENGRWELAGLPHGNGFLTARAPGYALLRRELDLANDRLALGDLQLRAAIPWALEIVDGEDLPLPGIEIRQAGEVLATTDSEGRATLDGGESEDLPLLLDADGVVAREIGVPSPRPELLHVRLERAWSIEGRLSDPDDRPVTEGRAIVVTGSHQRLERLDADGGFRLDLEPGREAELRLSSPATREVRLHLEAGHSGEIRDLGTIRAPRGMRVEGTLLRRADGSPVAGARVWALRIDEGGPLLAWMRRSFTETTVDAEGRFALEGLEIAPTRLRFDAPDLAPSWHDIVPEPGSEGLDLGVVEMSAGREVVVRLDGEEVEEALARIDLGGEGLAPDFFESGLRDGEAVFHHVPAGRPRISVLRDGRPICDREVSLTEDPQPFEFDCADEASRVAGQVFAGEDPAAGWLHWSPADSQQVPSVIMNFRGRGGLRQQRGLLQGRPPVRVELDDEGGFATSELGPGRWRVTWFSAGGFPSEERSVELPETRDHQLTLRFSPQAIIGQVLGEDGHPAAGVRVRELGAGTTAVTNGAGHFALRGLGAGSYRVQAFDGERTSEIAHVELEPGGDSEPLRLVLEQRELTELELRIFEAGFRPAAGAMVFVETDGAPARIYTADAEGRARLRLEPAPTRFRIAAFGGGTWAFGAWRSWDEALEEGGVELLLGETGGVRLAAAEEEGAVLGMRTAEGWDLAWLMTRLGRQPRIGAGREIVVSGLPPGRYELSLGSWRRTVEVEEGEWTELDGRDP